MANAGSAALDKQFSLAENAEARSALKDALAPYSASISADWIGYLGRDMRLLELIRIRRHLMESDRLRRCDTDAARALADFLSIQAIGPLCRGQFESDPACPADLGALFRWAAERLHTYGVDQSRCLRELAVRVADWCSSQGLESVQIVDSPLGGTVPAKVIASVLKSRGIDAQVSEFLAPRLEKHSRLHSIRSAALVFCKQLGTADTVVLFPDEVVTGTRFRKLYRALSKLLGDRLVPIAMHTSDAAAKKADKAKLQKLRVELSLTRTGRGGAPTFTTFPHVPLMKIDQGAPMVSASPFFWGEVDLCAGKRKVNFVFGLVNEFRTIAQELLTSNVRTFDELWNILREDSSGCKTVGHEPFIKQTLDRMLPLIRWDELEDRARITFGDEYVGSRQSIDDAWVVRRHEWVLREIYEQLLPHCEDKSVPNAAGVIFNVLKYLFMARGGMERRSLPSDRDFCEYTIPYAFPLRCFHDELVRLVSDDTVGKAECFRTRLGIESARPRFHPFSDSSLQ
ncbi:MAG TPA: hypothetical protein VK629_00165 [Steroidobacteraceae bacterium]|nr:hypothetical protein [Steroidobacteraceae bacterium]